MTFSTYDAAVPAFDRGLGVVLHLLDKAEGCSLGEAGVMAARLAPDMHPFPNQIRMAAFAARGATARLAGVDWPKTEDNEASLAELRETVTMSRDFVRSLAREAFDNAATRPVLLKLPTIELNFTGEGYLTSFALPNFYFHVSMAYAILRHHGVELGKRDYLGQLALV
jgi:uncharacterized protein